jgi:hypothetical protein
LQLLEDDPPPGSGAANTYVWGLENANGLVERDDVSGNRLYAQHDANMDVTALLSTGGTVVERFSYTPAGGAECVSGDAGSTDREDGSAITLQHSDNAALASTSSVESRASG